MALYKGSELIAGKGSGYGPVGPGSSIATPVGTIIPWMGSNDSSEFPDGFLLCDGRAVSRYGYSDLFAVIGTKFGSGDGDTTFNLPQLTDGRYLRGSAEADGTPIEESLPNITAYAPKVRSYEGVTGAFYSTEGSGYNHDGTQYEDNALGFDASLSSSVYKDGAKVTPESLNVLYLICYKVTNATVIGGAGSGGVIDGTICKDANGVECITLVTASEWAERQQDDGKYVYEYVVKNDCLLNIEYLNNVSDLFPDESVRIYINDVLIRISTDTMDSYSGHIDLPIKAGTVVKFTSEFRPDYNFNDLDGHKVELPCAIKLIEFKLNSLNPQVAFPDWDESKAITISSGDTISDNGWIIVNYLKTLGSVEITINDTVVTGKDNNNIGHYDSSIPVSIGDQVYITKGNSDDVSIKFYPAKSVSQEVPSNCVSYVIESGRFSSSDGTTHSDDSENDSWYRLYSDGWCEQGGTTIDDHNIVFYKSYVNDSYSVLALSDGTNYTKFSNKTNNGVLITNGTSGSDSISWEAKGFVS